MKRFISLILAVLIVLPPFCAACSVPAFAGTVQENRQSADLCGTAENAASFFRQIIDRIASFFRGIKYGIEIRKERVKNTMNQNAIHMLKSVTDTIGDSFIITTEDGKVIVVDGGFKTETEYFIAYLRQVTGSRKPHVDAWFLSHPHTDHCELFYEIVENRPNALTFDKVLVKFAPVEFYSEIGEEEGSEMVGTFDRLIADHPEKVRILSDADEFNIGAANIKVIYTFDPAFTNVNESSVIFRMELGGKSILFTGDAGVNAGRKALSNPVSAELLDCDICKMAHHGQDGCDRDFYAAVSPEICLWPTPSWVWDNTNGNLKTLEVRAWMQELGVKENYVAKDGSQVLFLDN